MVVTLSEALACSKGWKKTRRKQRFSSTSFNFSPLWTLDESCIIHKIERFWWSGGIIYASWWWHDGSNLSTTHGTKDYLCQVITATDTALYLKWTQMRKPVFSVLLFQPNHLWEVTRKMAINALKCIQSEIAHSQRAEWEIAQDSFMWWRENKWQITVRGKTAPVWDINKPCVYT